MRILSNIAWLSGDRILRMGVGVFVGSIVARYLGSENFGMLSYSIALVGICAVFSSLGLDSIVIRELTRQGERHGPILATTLCLRLAGAVLAALVSFGVVVASRPHDHLALQLVLITSFGTLFSGLGVTDLWFQSQIRSRYTVISGNIAFAVTTAIRLGLVWFKRPLMEFALVNVGELLLASLGSLVAYTRHQAGMLLSWKFERGLAKTLLWESFPLLFSGIAVMVYMRVDMLMLAQMAGDRAVGIYAAATRVSEILYFLPSAIVGSVMPSILAAKRDNPETYKRRLSHLFSSMTLLGYGVAIPMSLLAKPIISLLFGPGFASSAPVLAVHVWSAVFVFLGTAAMPYWLAENKQRFILPLVIIGAVINILLNFMWVPAYQAMGAAMATLVSYFVANVVVLSLIKSTRPLFFLMVKSIFNPFDILSRRPAWH